MNWIQENVILFLDENIPLKVEEILIEKGYNVKSVKDLYLTGSNDNKILQLIRENKWVLVTYDYHFYKMAKKYNKIAILVEPMQDGHFRRSGLVGIIIKSLHDNLKELKEYYAMPNLPIN